MDGGETAEEPPARRRGGAGARAPGASGDPRPSRSKGSASSTRTSTSSSSTSRAGWSCTLPRGTLTARWCTACSRRRSRVARSRSVRGSSPARPRHLRAPCRRRAPTRAHRRLQGLLRRRELVREYVALVRGRPRSRAGRIEAPIGATAATRPGSRWTPIRLATPRPPSSCSSCCRTMRSCASASRPGGPDPRPPRRDRPAGRR